MSKSECHSNSLDELERIQDFLPCTIREKEAEGAVSLNLKGIESLSGTSSLPRDIISEIGLAFPPQVDELTHPDTPMAFVPSEIIREVRDHPEDSEYDYRYGTLTPVVVEQYSGPFLTIKNCLCINLQCERGVL